jgi:hypothetical protein
MLGLQLDFGVAAVAGLEHEPTLVAVDAEIQILLAAQCLQLALQVIMRPQQGVGLCFTE